VVRLSVSTERYSHISSSPLCFLSFNATALSYLSYYSTSINTYRLNEMKTDKMRRCDGTIRNSHKCVITSADKTNCLTIWPLRDLGQVSTHNKYKAIVYYIISWTVKDEIHGLCTIDRPSLLAVKTDDRHDRPSTKSDSRHKYRN